MKSTLTKSLFCFVFAFILCGTAWSQDEEWSRRPQKFYMSSGGEMIFSWSNTTHPTSNEGSVLRWAPVFNFQSSINYDLGRAFGLMAGIAVRNQGYIYDFKNVDGARFKKKFRTYNLGIPVGIKIGNMDGIYIFGGYEFELPFHYKEKTFDVDGSKINKFTSWFSDRNQKTMQSLFAGIQMKGGTQIKFKYYLTELHNQNFTTTTEDLYPPSGDPNQPYKSLTSNVFYIALAWNISKKNYRHYKSKWTGWD
jgi:hypothetical protein